jgi:hypothetical protein
LIKAGVFKIKAKVKKDFANWGNLWKKLMQEYWKLLSQIVYQPVAILQCKNTWLIIPRPRVFIPATMREGW